MSSNSIKDTQHRYDLQIIDGTIGIDLKNNVELMQLDVFIENNNPEWVSIYATFLITDENNIVFKVSCVAENVYVEDIDENGKARVNIPIFSVYFHSIKLNEHNLENIDDINKFLKNRLSNNNTSTFMKFCVDALDKDTYNKSVIYCMLYKNDI